MFLEANLLHVRVADERAKCFVCHPLVGFVLFEYFGAFYDQLQVVCVCFVVWFLRFCSSRDEIYA